MTEPYAPSAFEPGGDPEPFRLATGETAEHAADSFWFQRDLQNGDTLPDAIRGWAAEWADAHLDTIETGENYVGHGAGPDAYDEAVDETVWGVGDEVFLAILDGDLAREDLGGLDPVKPDAPERDTEGEADADEDGFCGWIRGTVHIVRPIVLTRETVTHAASGETFAAIIGRSA